MSHSLENRIGKLEREHSEPDLLHVKIICFAGEPCDPTPRRTGNVIVSELRVEDLGK